MEYGRILTCILQVSCTTAEAPVAPFLRTLKSCSDDTRITGQPEVLIIFAGTMHDNMEHRTNHYKLISPSLDRLTLKCSLAHLPGLSHGMNEELESMVTCRYSNKNVR